MGSSASVQCGDIVMLLRVYGDVCPADHHQIIVLNITESRRLLWGKTRAAFDYVYSRYGDMFDWFLKADDDTYFVVENLRSFLNLHNPDHLIFFGEGTSPNLGKRYED
jgi:hypothetical protein